MRGTGVRGPLAAAAVLAVSVGCGAAPAGPVGSGVSRGSAGVPSGPAGPSLPAAVVGRPVLVMAGGAPVVVTAGAPVLDATLGGGIAHPDEGQFVSVRVTLVAGRSGPVPYSLSDFYVRDAGGAHYVAAIFGQRDPALDRGTLRPGERVSGWLAFDAPRHGVLVFAPGDAGLSVAEWRF